MLKATTAPQDLEAQLRKILSGLPLQDVNKTLRAAGAHEPMLVDMRARGLPAGTDLGGLRAGDRAASVTFGLRRRIWQPNLRIQLLIHFDNTESVTEVKALKHLAK